MNLRCILSALLAGTAPFAAPAQAQDHTGHHDHAMPSPTPAPAPEAAEPAPDDPHAEHTMPPAPNPHSGHTMPPAPDPHVGHAMEGAASPRPVTETPPPPAAGSGPPRAADAIWGAEAMAASRRALRESHGDFAVFWLQVDRLEAHVGDGDDGFLWDLQGYYGGPTSRFWFKSEGEGAFGDKVDDAEVQALYSRAVAPFWDLQLGVRQDLAGPETTHAVIGIQGLAPYLFEIDAAAFVSHRGDVTARIEAELDQRITQRLILQPRMEASFAAQDIPSLKIGSGIDRVEAGLRLRYEFSREFAPYVGIEQAWRLGGSADYARAAGEDPSVTSVVAGVRFWF